MNYRIIKRGSIYWFDPNLTYGFTYSYRTDEEEFHSSVQGSCRPWLVVSNDEGNEHSSICNIVPLTLEIKTSIPSHVTFRMNGKLQTVLCEQIRTVDIGALGGYISSIPEHAMRAVNEALRIQLGVKEDVVEKPTYIEDRIKNLEKAVKALQDAQISQDPSKGLKDAPKVLAESTKVAASSLSKAVSQIDKFNARLEKTKQLNEKPETELKPKQVSKKNVWTLESRKQYIKDCETMSSKEVMQKYGFTRIDSVYQTKYMHNRWLSENKGV